MEKPNLDSLTPKQAAYVAYLEGRCNGANRLIGELNLLSDAYAEDLEKIRLGKSGVDDANLTYLKESKTKAFERTLVLVDKIEKFKSLAKILEPESEKGSKSKKEKEVEAEPVEKPRKNIQDFALKNG